MRQKIRHLRLEVVGAKVYRTTTSIAILRSCRVEEALKKLVVSEESARAKIRRLGLEVVEQRKNVCSTTTSVSLVLPEELLSVEEAL